MSDDNPYHVVKDVNKVKPYEFGDAEQLVLYVLVKLYDLGYTQQPLFDYLKLVWEYQNYDMHTGDHGDTRTYLAINHKGDCKVWVCLYDYGRTPQLELSSVTIWTRETESSRRGECAESERVFFLSNFSGKNRLPPLLKNRPVSRTKPYTSYAESISVITDKDPAAAGWQRLGVLTGDPNPPYALDHLSQIWEMCRTTSLFVSHDAERDLASQSIGIKRGEGSVWYRPRATPRST